MLAPWPGRCLRRCALLRRPPRAARASAVRASAHRGGRPSTGSTRSRPRRVRKAGLRERPSPRHPRPSRPPVEQPPPPAARDGREPSRPFPLPATGRRRAAGRLHAPAVEHRPRRSKRHSSSQTTPTGRLTHSCTRQAQATMRTPRASAAENSKAIRPFACRIHQERKAASDQTTLFSRRQTWDDERPIPRCCRTPGTADRRDDQTLSRNDDCPE